MANTLHIRLQDNARIWTTVPKGTKDAVPLDVTQSKRLRQRITNLAKRDDSFKTHASRLKAGLTVRSNATGEIANAILSVF